MVIPLRDENPTRRPAVVTLVIIAANVVVFLFVQPQTWSATTELEAMDSQEQEIEFLYRNAAIPCEVRTAEPLSLAEINRGECGTSIASEAPFFPDKNVPWSIMASMFMHGGLLHIAGNMLFLWVFGNNVEDRFGPIAFTLFYVFTGIVATGAHVALNLDSTVPVVGASGAIAGVMGAYLVFWPHARILSVVPLFFIFQIVRLPAGVVLGLWFVMQFFTNPNSGVAWAAHVGGFLAGAAVALAMRPFQPRPHPTPEWR